MFKSERHFSVWDYDVGHSMLLIRSVKTDDHESNIDIIFYDVWAIDSIIKFDGIDISIIDTSSLVKNRYSQFTKKQHVKVFKVKDAKGEYEIVAAFFRVFENDLDSYITSINYYPNDDSNREIASGGF